MRGWNRRTLTLNSSTGSQEPIFNKTVNAEAAAEPNSKEEANRGSSCSCQSQDVKEI